MRTDLIIRSIKGIVKLFPLDKPSLTSEIFIDPAKCVDVPQRIMYKFNIFILYAEGTPFSACCMLQFVETVFTIVIIINKKYETNFDEYLKSKDAKRLTDICYRRELYIHELCHLIAMISVFPDSRQKKDEQEFLAKIKRNFKETLISAEESIPVSFDLYDNSPSDFDKNHFPYNGDTTNFNEVFGYIMMSDKQIEKTATEYVACLIDGHLIPISDYVRETLYIGVEFFPKFSDRRKVLEDKIRSLLKKA